MKRTPSARGLLGAALLAALLAGGEAQAKVEGYPYVDNETLGLFEVVRAAIAGPEADFAGAYWGFESFEETLGNMLGLARYLLAGASFATSAVAARLPAYRRPSSDALKKLVFKMLTRRAWQGWVQHYGRNPLGHDNLMYRGYLFHMMAMYQHQSGDGMFNREVTLLPAEGRVFRTDAARLARALAEETAAELDVQGQHHFNVACEPGQVFVICNTQHHMGFLLYDRSNATRHASVTPQWLAWVKARMVDPQSGMFYSMYKPRAKTGEQIDAGLSGLFNAMAIIFIDALDPAWGKSLYALFVKRHVFADDRSPHGPGTAVAKDGLFDKSGSLYEFALTLVTTGAAMVLARSHGDEALYQKLRASWELYLGKPSWDATKRVFSHRYSSLVPLVLQNGFPLWARASDASLNTGTNARRGPGPFNTPRLDQVDNARAFVNQAYYDEKRALLVITINGGEATREPAKLTLAGLDPAKRYRVERDGETYESWERDNESLVITSPPLSAREESYVISVDDSAAGCGCEVSGRGPTVLATLGLLLACGALARTRCRARRASGRSTSALAARQCTGAARRSGDIPPADGPSNL